MISNEAQSSPSPPLKLKCPTCNRTHHEKEDVFGNRKTAGDFDVREIFGITATCPICLEECTDVVALPCGHVLCKADYQRMGGLIQCMHSNDNENSEDNEFDRLLIHIRNAGQGGVNGTYRQHYENQNKYTSMGRYDGQDVEYSIEIRNANAEGQKKHWYLSCHTGNPSEPPIDFYRAKVNGNCAYPTRVRWEPATLFGMFPSPRGSHSYFH